MAKITISDSDFDQKILQSSKPALVDFWATWCGPCRVQGPIIDDLANEVGDAFVIGAIEVDANPGTSMRFNILSIPTAMIFKDGKVVWQGVGIHQKDQLLAELKKAA